MARMRKPDNVLKLEGNYDKNRHGDPDGKVDIEAEIPDKPDFFDDHASGEWDRVVTVLHKKGLLTALDRTILAQYCVLYGKFAANPEGFMATDHTQLRMQEQELGFTPSSRGKIITSKDSRGEGFRVLR